jgi:type II secretory pathway component PulF
MFAYDYPLPSILWSPLLFGLLVLWIFIVVWVFIDNFRRTDHGGWAEALVVFVPVIGVLSYIVFRPADPYAVDAGL